ncbi:hypothetical protein OCU04_001482 [Sclerotinia nivalis]|uniref:Uncharacterized protein n=1 Tax=Sclerotinia nivalis TaxID=352851 RepID=A0A9X0AY81_9HELO|nr:hypothetical protein OCU04_001482 [Sclerotinia nivalis]
MLSQTLRRNHTAHGKSNAARKMRLTQENKEDDEVDINTEISDSSSESDIKSGDVAALEGNVLAIAQLRYGLLIV